MNVSDFVFIDVSAKVHRKIEKCSIILITTVSQLEPFVTHTHLSHLVTLVDLSVCIATY